MAPSVPKLVHFHKLPPCCEAVLVSGVFIGNRVSFLVLDLVRCSPGLRVSMLHFATTISSFKRESCAATNDRSWNDQSRLFVVLTVQLVRLFVDFRAERRSGVVLWLPPVPHAPQWLGCVASGPPLVALPWSVNRDDYLDGKALQVKTLLNPATYFSQLRPGSFTKTKIIMRNKNKKEHFQS